MSDREDRIKREHDRMLHEHKEAMIKSGVEPDKAESTAARVMGEAAELLDRRLREKG